MNKIYLSILYIYFFVSCVEVALMADQNDNLHEITTSTCITLPGRYVLANNLVDPADGQDALIWIKSSHVELDLGDKSLIYGKRVGQKALKAAILLEPRVNNIVIKQGKIEGNGLLVGIQGSDNAQIKIKDVSIYGLIQSGVALSFFQDVQLHHLDVKNIYNAAGSAYGIHLQKGKTFSIENTQITQIVSGGTRRDRVVGVMLEACSAFRLSNLDLAENSGSQVPVYGVYAEGIDDFSWYALQSHKHLSQKANVIAFYCNQASNGCFNFCAAQDNHTEAGRLVGGFMLQNCAALELKNSKAAHGKAERGFSVGFYNIDGKYNEFIESTAKQNSGDKKACGFFSKRSYNTILDKCLALENSATSGNVYGIAFYREESGIIKYCSANHNTSLAKRAFGIGLVRECFGTRVISNRLISNQGREQFGFYDDALEFTTFLRGNVATGHGRSVKKDFAIMNSTMTNYYISGFRGDVTSLIKEDDLGGVYAHGANISHVLP